MTFTLVPENDWQQHLNSWPDRISHIKENFKFTDFRFIVGPNRTVFHAHKLIFAVSSPEFENLFYLLETNLKEIELPENSPEIFKIFINYIYSGKLDLTFENVKELIKLAKLYSITLLARKCENFLEQHAVKENVLKFLDLSIDSNLKQLTSKCLKVIHENSKEIYESPEFIKISKQSLDKIVKYEMMSFNGMILFKAVEWSEMECKKNKKEITPENKKAAVGETVSKIRFGKMSFEELVKFDENTSLNTVTDLLKKQSLPKIDLEKRIGQVAIGRFLRFPHGINANKRMNGGTLNIQISVNKNIVLCGYGVYGRGHGKATSNFVLKHGSCILANSSEEFICDGTDRIYEILLKNPVILEHSKLYSICERLDGPDGPDTLATLYENFYGVDGKTVIEENGVTLKINLDPNLVKNDNFNELTSGRLVSFIFRC